VAKADSQENIMARIIGAVDFKDRKRLHFIFDRTTDSAPRPLFETRLLVVHGMSSRCMRSVTSSDLQHQMQSAAKPATAPKESGLRANGSLNCMSRARKVRYSQTYMLCKLLHKR
jgi:hypothetical protein